MKWFLLCAAVAFLPLQAISKQKEPEPPPFDADLFKKDAQIFSIHTEFLYWTVEEGSVDYALKMRHAAWGPSPSYAQGKVESASFGFDPGFRIALLFFRAPRFWEVKWQYTRFSCEGDNSVGKPAADQKYITGTWPQITTAPLAKAESHIHMNYNVFDLLIDRYFVPNPHLRFRVLGGTIVAWINQDWIVHYFDSARQGTDIENRWKFIGGGLKSGTMVDWYWGENIYVTGLATVGVLMGNYQNSAQQTTNFQPLSADNTTVPIRDTSLSETRAAFTAQFVFGPSWQQNFSTTRMEVFAGYEVNVWMNLQEIYRSTAGGAFAAKESWINSSMIALQGLTVRMTVDF